MEKWTVARQIQWPEGDPVVEISASGIDYTNPDALVQKYPGEFEEFTDPRGAVKVAIEICRKWRRDGEKAHIGIGATGGMTMPFDRITFWDAEVWAKERYQSLEKCEFCGEILPEEYWTPEFPHGKFCSEFCVEEFMKDYEELDDADCIDSDLSVLEDRGEARRNYETF